MNVLFFLFFFLREFYLIAFVPDDSSFIIRPRHTGAEPGIFI